ncbi:MAG: tRNA (N6-isopentenyl adenosine(37)-C2)-methylthiotransferase MiaB [Oscillospiraceae bacterium]|nr:tRNA (N6-isopentenyl adenosine(37)-C2)-methylthiotransferase MiaB [Oscillospiraceae bacterium]
MEINSVCSKEAIEFVQELNHAKREPLKYFVRSYGCQQNFADSERIAGLLELMGCAEAANVTESDIIIFNTCGVRHTANERVFGNIGALKLLKRKNRALIIGVCGCMVEQQGVADGILKRFSFVDMVFGTNLIHMLPEFIFKVITKKEKILQTKLNDEIFEGLPVKRSVGPTCQIPIMYGCDNFCSYCVVPYVRGHERSREPENIIAEVKEAIAQNKKEILLLGQNVNSYGKGLAEDINFAKLLQKVAELDGDFRIRFLTSHPKDMSDELLEVIAKNKKICRHIHLPLQSGSNEVLKNMNRKYTREKYLELINKIKAKLPDCSLSSDVIVGFPGETRQDFEQTLELIKQVEFAFLFMFLFSKRPGTAAEKLPDVVPSSLKKAWFTELVKSQEEIGAEKHKEQIGKEKQVLPDHFKVENGEVILAGKCDQNFLVEFEGTESMVNKFVNVKITKAQRRSLWGQII